MATLWKSKRALDLMHPSTGLLSFGTLVCCYDFTKQMTQDLAPILRHPDLVGSWPLFGEGTSRPIYKTNVLNGRSAARFDGVNDLLQTASNFGTNAGLSGNAAFTAVWVSNKSTLGKGMDFGWGNTVGALSGSGYYEDTLYNGYGFGGAGNHTGSTNRATSTWFLSLMTKAAGAINTTAIYRRNGVVNGAPASTSTPNISGSNPLVLGRFASFTGTYFHGDIAFLALYSGAVSNVSGLESFVNSYVGGIY